MGKRLLIAVVVAAPLVALLAWLLPRGAPTPAPPPAASGPTSTPMAAATAPPPPLAPDAVALPEQAPSLTGTVVIAATGEPLGGVGVWARGPGDTPAETISESDGSFALFGLEAGLYQPLARGAGWVGFAPASVEVGWGSVPRVKILVLGAGALLGTAVHRTSGRPCAGGVVNLGAGPSSVHHRLELDRSGVVESHGLLPGRYAVSVECSDALRWVGEVVIDAGNLARERWEVEAGLGVRGRIQFESGDPVVAAQVEITGDSLAAGRRLATTDVAGTYATGGLGPGTHRVTALAPGSAVRALGPAVSARVSEGEPWTVVDLTVPDAGALRGLVLGPGDEPAAGVFLFTQDQSPGGWRPDSLVTDGNGRFNIDPLRPGTYRIWPMGRRQDPELRVGVEVRAGEVAEVTLELAEALGAITGRVFAAEGEPAAGARVSVLPPGPMRGWWRRRLDRSELAGSVTDADGNFILAGVPTAGSFDVLAAAPRGARGIATGAAAGDNVLIALEQGGSIAGRVVTEAGEAPWVFALHLSHGGRAAARSERFTSTGGQFRVEHLAVGEWELTVDSPAGMAQQRVRLAGGDSVEDLTIVLEGSAEVRGRFVDFETGEPVAGAEILTGPGRDRWQRRAVSGPGGEFALTDVPPGWRTLKQRPPRQWVRTSQRLHLAAGQSLQLGDLRLVRKPEGETGRFGFRIVWPPTASEELPPRIVVRNVSKRTPAARAGLKAGDIIVAVDGYSVDGPDHYMFWGLIRAADGQVVELAVADGRTLTMVAQPRPLRH